MQCSSDFVGNWRLFREVEGCCTEQFKYGDLKFKGLWGSYVPSLSMSSVPHLENAIALEYMNTPISLRQRIHSMDRQVLVVNPVSASRVMRRSHEI